MKLKHFLVLQTAIGVLEVNTLYVYAAGLFGAPSNSTLNVHAAGLFRGSNTEPQEKRGNKKNSSEKSGRGKSGKGQKSMEDALKLVEKACPCSNSWKNNGKYISCVGKAVKDPSMDFDENQQQKITRKAAKSKCGKKKEDKEKPRKQKKVCDTMCGKNNAKISLCHFDSSLKAFTTQCVDNDTAKKYLKNSERDHCGSCTDDDVVETPGTKIQMIIPSTLTLLDFDLESPVTLSIFSDTIFEIASKGLDEETQRVEDVMITNIEEKMMADTIIRADTADTDDVSDTIGAENEEKDLIISFDDDYDDDDDVDHTIEYLNLRRLQTMMTEVEYNLVLEELCTSMPCDKLANMTTMYDDVTIHISNEIDSGRFTEKLQANAEECIHEDCREIENVEAVNGAFGKKSILVLTDDPTEAPAYITNNPTGTPTTAEPKVAPTTVQPTSQEPTTAKPTSPEPTTAKPTSPEPTTAKPISPEPTTAHPDPTSSPSLPLPTSLPTEIPALIPTQSPALAPLCSPRLRTICCALDKKACCRAKKYGQFPDRYNNAGEYCQALQCSPELSCDGAPECPSAEAVMMQEEEGGEDDWWTSNDDWWMDDKEDNNDERSNMPTGVLTIVPTV